MALTPDGRLDRRPAAGGGPLSRHDDRAGIDGEPGPPRDHWYIAAPARAVERRPIGVTVLGEPLVLFRGVGGRPAALVDRCVHRNMALSAGRVVDGTIECPYHGWRYDTGGRCIAAPALGAARCPAATVRAYPAVESDGYVWVFMGRRAPPAGPFRFPHLGEPGWTSFRMEARFPASAFACAENFLDCPHTAFVHRGWFRPREARALRARVRRYPAHVEAEFADETPARSVVSALFFPADRPLEHTDRFLLPAITRVDYRFGPTRHFIITSQCTPVSVQQTRVYTVITFRFGSLGPLARLLLEPLSRWIIRQDVAILARQTAQLERFGGPRFLVVDTDLFASHIRALWRSAAGIEDDVTSAGDAAAPTPASARPVAAVSCAVAGDTVVESMDVAAGGQNANVCAKPAMVGAGGVVGAIGYLSSQKPVEESTGTVAGVENAAVRAENALRARRATVAAEVVASVEVVIRF